MQEIKKLKQLVKKKQMARRNNAQKAVLDKIQKEIAIQTLLYMAKAQAQKQSASSLHLVK